MAIKSLFEMTQAEAERAFARTQLAVIPAGSVEQHGPTLPMGTDSMSAIGVARSVAEKMNAVLVPFSPIGFAPYHLPWRGSLSFKATTFISMFLDICECLQGHGITQVLGIIGHEGNVTPLRMAADEAQHRFNLRVVLAEAYVVLNRLYPRLELTHAAVQEAVAAMFYDPTLVVDLSLVGSASDADTGNREHARYRQKGVFPILKDFREVAPTGYYGVFEQPTREFVAEALEKVSDAIAVEAGEIFDAARKGFAACGRK